MKKIHIALFTLISIAAYSQDAKPTVSQEDNNIYSTGGIEVRPDFPGGLQEFYNYIGKNFKVPDVKGLSGKVIVTFVVEKDGSLTDVKVIRDIGYGTKEEAIRVVENSPHLHPENKMVKKSG